MCEIKKYLAAHCSFLKKRVKSIIDMGLRCYFHSNVKAGNSLRRV